MALKKTLQKIGEWVDDVSKATTGTIKATLEKGPLRDLIDDFAGIGGPIGLVFKIASRQIPDPTAEQLIASELSTTFFTQLHKARIDHPELCQEQTWRAFVKDPEGGVKKANELLAREFSWFALFGKGDLLPSRSWPLVADLADIAEVWFVGATIADKRHDLEARRKIETIRGRIADELAKTVESVLQKDAVRDDLEKAIAGLGRETLDRLAGRLAALDRVLLFGEIPQNELYIPPTLKYVDFRNSVPDGDIDWKKVEPGKGAPLVREQIKRGDPRLVVLFGDMGAGKSCLMRSLAADVAAQYLRDKKLAPVFVRWRDVYQNSDLLPAIAKRVQVEHGIPTEDLAQQNDVVYFLDGFDEMTSHQTDHIWDQFERVLRLVTEHKHTVVIAMRSAVVTRSVQRAWREKKAFVAEVQPFTKEEVNGWAIQWQMRTLDTGVTGDRMRQLAGDDVTTNPLLLYMLARYVHPDSTGARRLGRAMVFRKFVDETITGRLRDCDEKYPLSADTVGHYRLLLQEMAFVASWPASNGKCSELTLRQEVPDARLKQLKFSDLRSAFVMHFFDPGDALRGEFEFQPEGFRHYLLAEWCVRRQLEAHQDEMDFRTGTHQLARAEAVQTLAQFPLREVERELIDELFTELGELARDHNRKKELMRRLGIYGFERESEPAQQLVQRLLSRLGTHAVIPPLQVWKADNRIGIPEKQPIPECLDALRMLVNYWDQCLMGYFGLSRGVSDQIPIPEPREGRIDLGRFVRLRIAVRGFQEGENLNLNLNRQNFSKTELNLLPLIGIRAAKAHLSGADLSGADLSGADLSGANLRGAELSDATLFGSYLINADLGGANLGGAILSDANLRGAKLMSAKLMSANLKGAHMTNAHMTNVDLSGANLISSHLTNADLGGAILSGASLRGAKLISADLRGADLSGVTLSDAYLINADLRGANLRGAHLHDADLRGADLHDTRLPKGFKPPPGTKGTPLPDEDDPPADAKPEAP